MSPVPLIELQRRLSIVGAIRAGGEKQPHAPGKRLENFRLTSPKRDLVEQAAALYGGTVSPWTSPTGEEWQVYTEAEELPVLVMPSYSLRQTYELWEGPTKRQRLCDGMDEELSGGPCICQAEGRDLCDIYTRFVVALPELDTVLGWKLTTTGANAAHELPTTVAMIESVSGGQPFVPARLRLDQRRGVKEGQVVRFVVPTLDLGVGYLALASRGGLGPRAIEQGNGAPEVLPRTFTPAPGREAISVRDAVRFEPREEPMPGGGATLPRIPPPDPAPIPVEDDGPSGYPEERQTKAATDAQKKKLNLMVGQLRERGHLRTEVLYDAVAHLRGIGGLNLAAKLNAKDANGVLHWSPLREVLTRPEAAHLLDRLEALEARVAEATAPPAPAPEPEPEAAPPHDDIPF